MKKIQVALPWVLALAVLSASGLLIHSGYKPKAVDVTIVGVDADDAERRQQEFVRKLNIHCLLPPFCREK